MLGVDIVSETPGTASLGTPQGSRLLFTRSCCPVSGNTVRPGAKCSVLRTLGAGWHHIGELETGHGESVHTTDTGRGYGSSCPDTSTPQPWPLVNPLLPITPAFRPQMPSPLWPAWPFLPHKQGPLPCNDHRKVG